MKNKKVKNEIEYTLEGDYYIPNLVLEKEETTYLIRKYGKQKLKYLKEHKKAEYINLFMDEKLNKYLHEIDEECEKKFDFLIEKMKKEENITEELKTMNQMEWVAKMNGLKNRVDEIILREYIYN